MLIRYLCLVCVIFFMMCCNPANETEKIYIAVVGPMTGNSELIGKSFVQGVKLYLNETKEQNKANGKQIEIDIYDDKNNAKEASKIAFDIAQKNRHIGIIGHHYSSCSISAGQIYKLNGIPAISPASTNIKVTENNEWYFRANFNDSLQSQFLAIYVKEVFQKDSVSIIHEDLEYGSYLSEIFEKKSRELGINVKYIWKFNVEDSNLDETLENIVCDLSYKEDAGIVFLATHSSEGIKILKHIKDKRINFPVITPDAFAASNFQTGFESFPKEKETPGYYTNGIYVTTPLIFDTANDKGQKFKNNYVREYDKEPGWHAAFAYDTIMILDHAIKDANITGNQKIITQERAKLRDKLASICNSDLAIKGATGINYFDEKGDSQKPVSIGVYKNQNIVSALTQLQSVNNINEISDISEAIHKKMVIYVDDKYMYKTNVVYTGIKINEISELDIDNLTAKLDFYLWFRFQGSINTKEIDFINSVEPIKLDEPIKKTQEKNISHHLYRIKSKFKLDFLPKHLPFGYHMAGIRFHHNNLTRNNLIYVVDVLGMGTAGNSLTEQLKKSKVLSPVSGWCIDDVSFFQDIAEESSLGLPKYLNSKKGIIKYSQFNVGILIKKSKFNIREIASRNFDYKVLLISSTLLIAIFVLSKRFASLQLYNVTWFFQTILVFITLLSGEVFILNWMTSKTSIENLKQIKTIFDIFWWLIPAFCLISAISRFIWNPLEEKTGRKIPSVVKRLTSVFIIMLAIFGIIAYVIGEKITGLLATSGVAAMIIGLAVQMNLSNIFSGIALNMERPFRTDDWVKINDNREGKILDVGWRTTRIQLRDNSVIHIPNSIVCESIIMNYCYPNKIIERPIIIHVNPGHALNRVQKIITDALLSVDVILKYPNPIVRFKGMTEWSAMFGVYYSIDDYSKKWAIEEVVWKRIRAHLKRAGIAFSLQRHVVYLSKGLEDEEKEPAKPINLLQEIDVFQPFSDDAKSYLSQKIKHRHYRSNESIVNQGDVGDSLFIIVEGVVSVRVKLEQDNTIEVARLGAGKFFGEMALLTGEPRTANVIALTDTYLIEITKGDIAPLIQKQPEISEMLGEVLAHRKMKTESMVNQANMVESDNSDMPKHLVSKILNYFGIKK